MSETPPSPEVESGEPSPDASYPEPVIVEPDGPRPTLVDPEPPAPIYPSVEASVWRLSPAGFLITSVVESHVGTLAEMEPNTIYFYADLGGVDKLTNTDETMQKVYQALSGVGLTEGQIVNATNAMQAAGVLFRERAI